jgi:hypothetical protein
MVKNMLEIGTRLWVRKYQSTPGMSVRIANFVEKMKSEKRRAHRKLIS